MSNSFTERRYGNVAISLELLKDLRDDELALMFSKFVVTQVNFNLAKNVLEYQGTSPEFAPLKRGDLIPFYKGIFTTTGEGWKFHFEK